MKYLHRFDVQAPLEIVRAFHSRSASMSMITPPPIVVQMHEAPLEPRAGDVMAFALWIGPLPVRWRAQIDYSGPSGPFDQWIHQHIFIPGDGFTTVVDVVEVNFSLASSLVRTWRIHVVGFTSAIRL